MSDFLPANYEVPSKSNYTKLGQGETVLRILENPVIGNELWIEGNPKRYRNNQPIPMKDQNEADVDDRTGLPKPPRHFWAMVVWNYKSNQLQIWQVSQKKIMAAITALSKSKGWGSPLQYDLSITREGEGFDTNYTVLPQPKEELSKEIAEAYKTAQIDLNKLFTGEDPFTPSDYVDDAMDALVNEEENIDS